MKMRKAEATEKSRTIEERSDSQENPIEKVCSDDKGRRSKGMKLGRPMPGKLRNPKQ
jgi:hypothetical protein